MPLLVVAITLAFAPSAAADTTPVDLGAGGQPAVAVGSDGTAYIAWVDNVSGPGTFYFCRLPRGASTCASSPVHFTPSPGVAGLHVSIGPSGALVIVGGSCCFPISTRVEEWTSSDGGSTWSPAPSGNGTTIGSPTVADTSGDSILSPDGSGAEIINAGPTTGGVRFQFDPLDGSGAATTTDFQFGEAGDLGGSSGTLASASNSLTVAAFTLAGSGSAYSGSAFSLYSGAPGPAMNSGGWSAIQHLDPAADITHLTQGPAGVGLLEDLNGTCPAECKILYRRFDGTSSFGPPATVSNTAGNAEAVTQDAGGHINAVWTFGFTNAIYCNRSDDGGTNWPSPATLVHLTAGPAGGILGVGAGADGAGWVVYAANPSGTPHAFAVPLNCPSSTPPPTTPAISSLRVSPAVVSIAGRVVHGHCVAPTRRNRSASHCVRPIRIHVSYTLNAAATVTFTVKRVLPGRRVSGRCVRPTSGNRTRPRCTRLVSVPGRITLSGAAGANHFIFRGQVGGRRLGPGSYKLIATPSAGGRSGMPRSVRFRIVG